MLTHSESIRLLTFNDIPDESRIMEEYPPIIGPNIEEYRRLHKLVSSNIFDIFDTDIFMHDWDYHRGRHILIKVLNTLVNINNVKKYVLIANEKIDLEYENASIRIQQFMVLTDNDVIIEYDIRNMYMHMYLSDFHASYNTPYDKPESFDV